MNDPKFVNGLLIKPPHERAPDFVKAAISIKVEDLMKWLAAQQTDWVNIDVKVSGKTGKWYAQVNDWQPSEIRAQAAERPAQSNQGQAQPPTDFDDDIPF